MKTKNTELFAKNLNRILKEKKISQYKMIQDLDLKKTTVNYWCKGKSFPRYDALKKVADYLDVAISELTGNATNVDKSSEEERAYYLDPETRKTAEELRTNKDLKTLFDAARDASPEDLKTVHAMLLALKRKEQHIDEY